MSGGGEGRGGEAEMTVIRPELPGKAEAVGHVTAASTCTNDLTAGKERFLGEAET